MNRQSTGPPSRAPSTSVPTGLRQPSSSVNGMYYATAGSQTTTTAAGVAAGAGGAGGAGAQAGAGRLPMGQGSFPPVSGGMRAGPPGFSSRGADLNDFPALGSINPSHPPHLTNSSSTYAAQAQPASASASAQSQQHLQQQLFMQQQSQQQGPGQGQAPAQGQGQLGNGLAPPPPPPGLSGPVSTQSNQPNGMMSATATGGDSLRGEDFPALGAADGKMPQYMKNPAQPPSPQSTMNGPSSSQAIGSANPAAMAPHPTGTSAGGGPPPPQAQSMDSSWVRLSPSRPTPEPILRPVQQILSSPVDKWGLQQLLYEIKTAVGDRNKFLFGEDLDRLGVELLNEDPLYSSFVTPWAETSQLRDAHIEDAFQIPSCYLVNSQPIETKIPHVTEDTLFYMFYSKPRDILQLQAAEELYNRGWRYHTELMVWMQSPAISSLDLRKPEVVGQTPPIRGAVLVFNPQTFSRTKLPDDFGVDVASLEVTKPATMYLSEAAAARKEARAAAAAAGQGGGAVGSGKSPNPTPASQQLQGHGGYRA